MRITQWKIVPALVASVMVIGGCQTNGPTRGSEPPQLVRAQSIVHEAGKCSADAGREPHDFLVTIYVREPGTPLFKEGSRLIAPGEVPVFRVLRVHEPNGEVEVANGTLHITFVGQVDANGKPIVDDRGRHLQETPFVAGKDKVFDFVVDKKGNLRPGERGSAQGLRARTMCDDVCTFERPCKYSITYVPENGDEYPELDPYTIIH